MATTAHAVASGCPSMASRRRPPDRKRRARPGQNAAMQAVFVDANATLAAIARRIQASAPVPFELAFGSPGIAPAALPALLDGATVAVVDHTALPLEIAKACRGLRDVVFLGTGARSYMDPEARAGIGVAVHTIKGYGDTAVAECAIGLLWAAARGFAAMDRAMRTGIWERTEGVQLTGKTLGLIGFGGVAAETARLALGCGMRVRAWNRTAKAHPGVAFVPLERLLAESDAVSLHLVLCDETRGFLSRARIAAMRPGAILVNTARGALVDEAALIEALRSGQLRHAALDVFEVEPLPREHPLTGLANVTLSAHSAFRTAEANERLVQAAFEHLRRIAGAA